jgi:Lysine methyltransferase
MNFVRFVKTPRIDSVSPKKPSAKKNASKPPSSPTLLMILTVTTDFSTFAGSTELGVTLVSPANAILSEKEISWSDTSRELKVELELKPGWKEGKVVVYPLGRGQSIPFLSRYLGRPIEHIVGVESPTFQLSPTSRVDTVYRRFSIDGVPFRIAEQSGETIIRHVWDAGIILSAAATCNPTSLPPELQIFMEMSGIARVKAILEVGTGVGVLGLSLAARYPKARVVVTDLEDAEPLVLENIAINAPDFPQLTKNVSFRPLDWEARPFPDWTTTDIFDLIVMADVTYNTATFVALANTLEHLQKHGAKGAKGAKVICCGKRRHDEEEEFWKIVKGRGFELQERKAFAMDLEGRFRYCGDGIQEDGEQVIDFIVMTLSK